MTSTPIIAVASVLVAIAVYAFLSFRRFPCISSSKLSGYSLIEDKRLPKRIKDWGISANVWSCPSFNELARDGQACDRHNLLNPAAPASVSFVAQQLEKHNGPVVASTDYMKAYAEQIRSFTDRKFNRMRPSMARVWLPKHPSHPEV